MVEVGVVEVVVVAGIGAASAVDKTLRSVRRVCEGRIFASVPLAYWRKWGRRRGVGEGKCVSEQMYMMRVEKSERASEPSQFFCQSQKRKESQASGPDRVSSNMYNARSYPRRAEVSSLTFRQGSI